MRVCGVWCRYWLAYTSRSVIMNHVHGPWAILFFVITYQIMFFGMYLLVGFLREFPFTNWQAISIALFGTYLVWFLFTTAITSVHYCSPQRVINVLRLATHCYCYPGRLGRNETTDLLNWFITKVLSSNGDETDAAPPRATRHGQHITAVSITLRAMLSYDHYK